MTPDRKAFRAESRRLAKEKMRAERVRRAETRKTNVPLYRGPAMIGERLDAAMYAAACLPTH